MSQLPDRVFVRAPAKINLFLEILGQRPDGYHDLRSIVVPISVCDSVVLEKIASGIELIIKDQGAANGSALKDDRPDRNLAVRAAAALKDATGYAGGARIHLEKCIPVGGGLGGGSADAAAVLMGLNDLWQSGLSRETLMKIGLRLGCDIPALVRSGAVCMAGVGDRVQPLPIGASQSGREWWLVVANPGFGVSTRDIYARHRGSLTSASPRYTSMCFALETGDIQLAARSLFNGLQDTVCRKYPLIELLVEGLVRSGAAGAMVSGSGASVFGLAADEADARRIAVRAPAVFGFPVWLRVARVLPDGVMVAHGPLEA